MNTEETVYCGIDVSKRHLDAIVNGRPRRFDNTIQGIESMMTKLGMSIISLRPQEAMNV